MAALLTSLLAERIHAAIAAEPIVDFHTHLPQREILEDRQFADLGELWLAHDHYKWRLMRACGVAESHITGDAGPFEKFRAFACCLPLALGNPVQQWVQLELAAVFGIADFLDGDSAAAIWERANAQLRERWSVRRLLEHFAVELVCTTDDPADCLAIHQTLADEHAAGTLVTRVLPTFRPDRLCYPHQPQVFAAGVAQLAARVGGQIDSFAQLVKALRRRHDAFHALGCRMSDHGLPFCPALANLERHGEGELDDILARAVGGQAASDVERDLFAAAVMREVAGWNAARGWVMQLHLGPWRNVNTTLSARTGPDAGIDTIGPWRQTEALVRFLDSLRAADILPRTIVYHLEPGESEAICCALQSFQDERGPATVQYGPAWWHRDHAPGIRRQLEATATLSALGTGLGMLTDSRSFTSFVRHDYFRRILAAYLAEAAQRGEMPNDEARLVGLARRLAGANAREYLGGA